MHCHALQNPRRLARPVAVLAALSVSMITAHGASATAPGTPDGQPRGTNRLVSKASDGTRGDGFSRFPSVSDGGRVVVYESYASNLVSGDTNFADDVFAYDRKTRKTTMLSRGTGDPQAYKESVDPSISGNGRYVAFSSEASNLVSGDTNGDSDVFLHDRRTGTTIMVSRTQGGLPGNKDSRYPSISRDGRFVTYASDATNLDPDDGPNTDVFLYDRTTGRTDVITLGTRGEGARGDSVESAISADGSYVAFSSTAPNLVEDDENGVQDVFVLDRAAGTIMLASLAHTGDPANGASQAPSISADGRSIAFTSFGSDLVTDDPNGRKDVFVRDLDAGATELITVAGPGGADGHSDEPVISGNGRTVAYSTSASNLVEGDDNGFADVVSYDRRTGVSRALSLGVDGTTASGASFSPMVARDGKYVAFFSWAEDIVKGDGNGYADVIVHRLR